MHTLIKRFFTYEVTSELDIVTVIIHINMGLTLALNSVEMSTDKRVGFDDAYVNGIGL